MSRTKKRNHFVPELLLRRFASRKEGKTSWIWRFRRHELPLRDFSTRDVGVSKFFHGLPSTGVEALLEKQETRIGAILKKIDQGEGLDEFTSDLAWFVWTLSVRTRALREGVGNTVHAGIGHLTRTATSEDAKSQLMRHAHEHFDKHVGKAIARLPIQVQSAARAALARPELREQLAAQLRAHLSALDLGSEVSKLVDGPFSTTHVEEAVQDGHVRALHALLTKQQAPTNFAPRSWTRVAMRDEPLLLGDCCVIAVGAPGETGALTHIGKDWSECYLPIDPNNALVALRGDGQPTLNAAQLNVASARNSLTEFFASQKTGAEAQLAALIGSQPTLMALSELERSFSWDRLG